MSQTSSRNLLEGVGTFAAGLVLWLSTEGVEVPVVTLTKVGVVMMCVPGVYIALGLYRAAHQRSR
ncbi:hypothetical protein M2271_005340 [Streptomyces sp. LBL]|uniref:DUF5708 family protein n=1 Tax=Streptomyces sp. LBL TaxID=2940562 RepID=UPI0024765798|nr:DUF5708 family protein [Streptomyces sp. LBL]MDH6627514.1 hypothetical protein [Streptomyces sp. LBL]